MDKPIDFSFRKRREKYLAYLRDFCLMDDTFMSRVFKRKECASLLLQIVLERNDLVVTEVRTQEDLKNLYGRSVCLDILAVDHEGKIYNIEIQRKDEGAVAKRARYNSALLDANITDPGENFEALKETYIIFITEHDVLKSGLPLYHIDKVIRETGALFQDESHIIYVNSQIQDESALGKLMHDFYCKDPNEMYFPVLADETRYFKENEKGVETMCKAMEEIRDEGRVEGRVEGRAEGRMEGRMEFAKEIAVDLAKSGHSVNDIAHFLKQNVPTVQSWIKGVSSSV